MLLRRAMSLSQLLGSDVRTQGYVPSDLFSTNVSVQPRVHDFFWPQNGDDDRTLPVIAIPAGGDLETFFADVATFYPNISPISAYMHVLGENLAYQANFAEMGQPRSFDLHSNDDERRTKIWVALTMAEAASNAAHNATGSDVDVTYSLCRRTMAFALARAAFLYPDLALDDVAGKWTQLRELTKMDFHPAVVASILWVARNLFEEQSERADAEDPVPALSRMIRGFFDRSVSPTKFSDFLAGMYPEITPHLAPISGNYDGRMDALNRIITVIRRNPHGPENDALSIGYFCNAILPGSLSHVRLLSRFVAEYPSVLVWYGFFSGSSEGFDWKRPMSGIGQKLSRDICSQFSHDMRPSSDIDLEELAVLSRIGITSSVIKPVHERSMLVSLLPGIDVFARLPVDIENQGRHSAQDFRSADRDRQLAERDNQVQRLLSEAQQLLGKRNPSSDDTRTSLATKSPRRNRKITPSSLNGDR